MSKSVAVTILIVAISAGIFYSGCAEQDEFSGEGGVLDSPVSLAVFGDYAYVANSNFDLSDDGDGWLSVIHIPTAIRNRKQCIVSRVNTEPFLGQILINREGTIAYVAGRKQNRVLLFDLSDPERPEQIDTDPSEDGVQGIQVGVEPVGLALARDEQILLVANVGSGDLSIVDLSKSRLIRNLRLGWGITRVAVDPEGRYAYVTNKGINSISVIEIETARFVAGFSVGDPNTGLDQDTRGVAFSKDGKYAYIAVRRPPSLAVIETEKLPYYPERAVQQYIPMDNQPSAVAVTPDGKEIWVANYASSSVFVIDARSHTVSDVVQVGTGPYDIAFSTENPDDPGHYYTFIANFLSHNVSLLDSRTKDYIWAIP
jgi:YVTN family beta-propeller protein